MRARFIGIYWWNLLIFIIINILVIIVLLIRLVLILVIILVFLIVFILIFIFLIVLVFLIINMVIIVKLDQLFLVIISTMMNDRSTTEVISINSSVKVRSFSTVNSLGNSSLSRWYVMSYARVVLVRLNIVSWRHNKLIISIFPLKPHLRIRLIQTILISNKWFRKCLHKRVII